MEFKVILENVQDSVTSDSHAIAGSMTVRSKLLIASMAKSASPGSRADEPPRSNPARTSKVSLVSRAHNLPPPTESANALYTYTYHSYDYIGAHPNRIHREITDDHQLAHFPQRRDKIR